MKWIIQCGEHEGVVEAKTIGAAWRKLTKDKQTGFAELVRFARYYSSGVWQYITPQALDKMR